MDLLEIKTSNHSLRSSGTLMLRVPAIKSKATLGDRSFFFAPKLWNCLPSNILQKETLASSKNSLKTYFFKLAYN